ncbi:MAG: transposase [Actinomycetota bacterium]|nr:transposase [Actinomycetota bacterium]
MARPLLTQPILTQLIADHWSDLLRLVGSMKFGHTTASLLIDGQVDQALCLTLVTNAVLWTTTYLGDALDALRAEGYAVTDEAAAHLTPAQHDHINFYGTPTPPTLKPSCAAKGTAPFRSPAA